MLRPKILLTPQHEENSDRVSLRLAYTDAVINAGGLPLAVSLFEDDEYIKELMHTADGLLLTGGDDVAPELYGETRTDKCGAVSALRDAFEIKAARLAAEKKVPVLGICRGIQVMNVAFGGSLYEDMGGHMQRENKSSPSHFVTVTSSPIFDIYGKRSRVNSFHHQAVKRIGDGLRICAVSDDGYTEAVFLPGHPFFVGVQWHPEHMVRTDASAAKLFEKFVKCAAEYSVRTR